MIKNICLICKKEFINSQHRYRIYKFCSRACYGLSKKGKPNLHYRIDYRHSKETKRKMSIAHKGLNTWLKGKKLSEEHKKNISNALKGKNIGSDSGSWKGGKTFSSQGYIDIINPNRFNRDKRKYIREHRIIIEKIIKRPLKQKEQVHHIGERNNNNPKMLIAFSSMSAHIRFHKNPNNVKPSEIIFDGRKL